MTVILQMPAQAVPLAIVAGMLWLRWRIARGISDRTAQRATGGARVPLTPLARAGLGTLPADATLFARIGSTDAPRADPTSRVLRATVGVRAISLGVTALVLILTWGFPGTLLPDDAYLALGLTALLLYAAASTLSAELRYDTDGLEVRTPGFRRVQIPWRDLASIQDNGHYLYILRSRDGRRAEVLKYLTGMPDFLAYAQAQMKRNDARHAGTARG